MSDLRQEKRPSKSKAMCQTAETLPLCAAQCQQKAEHEPADPQNSVRKEAAQDDDATGGARQALR